MSFEKRWDEILEWGERWIALGNTPEAAYRALMAAHAESGDPAAVAAVYQRCVEVLRAELGVEPAAETRALYETLKATGQPGSPSLPVHPTALIDRDQELGELAALLADPACRLLTLVGPGGIGKTRLALAVAHAQGTAFPHGIYFVSLAPVNSVQFLVPTIAGGVGLAISGAAEPKAQLIYHLRGRQMLVVLDSFEHLLSGVTLLAEMLAATTGIKLIVTSRERLNLQGEWLFEVLGLEYPNHEMPPAEAAQFNAVKLFTQTARRMRPSFTLDGPDLAAVSRICRLVGGMPLGIELAASWVRSFSCAEIADELERNVGFLNTPLRDVPERHRNMQAIFNYSWELLSADEQSAFRAQSVFRGGFTREAAERVTAASAIQLSVLVDKSLLRRAASGRFEAHELLRQFAHDLLAGAGQLEAMASCHATYYLALAEQAEPELHGPRQNEWLARLEADHDNFRAALGWALASGQGELAARLCSGLWWFWYLGGYLVEGRRWLHQVLTAGQPLSDAVHAKALFGAASLAWFQGDFAAARSLASGSVALWRRLGDPHGLGAALTTLGLAQGHQGDQALAHSLLEESVAICREIGDDWGLALALCYYADPQAGGFRDAALAEWVLGESLRLFQKTGDPWGMALPLHGLGEWQYAQEEFAAARTRFEEALVLRRNVGDNWLVAQTLGALGDVARCQNDYQAAEALYAEGLKLYQAMGSEGRSGALLHHLGYVALHQQDYDRAGALFAESLGLFRHLADNQGIIACLDGVAGVWGAQGRSLPAARLLGAAEALRADNGAFLQHADRAEHERAVAAALLPSTLESFEAAWAEGRAMTLTEAMEAALAQ